MPKSIYILQTSVPEMHSLANSFTKVLCRTDIDVKILLPSRNSPHRKYRSLQRYYEDDGYGIDRHINTTLANLSHYIQECSSNLKASLSIKFYEGTPTVAVYWIDDTMFIGPFWRKCSSSSGPNFVISDPTSSVAKAVKKHWELVEQESMEDEELWDNSKNKKGPAANGIHEIQL